MKKIIYIILLVLMVVLLGAVFLAPAQKTEAASLYTPFGGRVEKYIKRSDAQCVKDACKKIDKPIHDAIKKEISGPKNALCATIAATCSFIPLVGNAACFIACIKIIDKTIEEAISICAVEEIRVGPPRPALLGIINIGVLHIDVSVTIPVPFLPDIHISIISFDLNLFSFLPGIFDVIPDPKIYRHGEYKTEGNWVLGDSLNLSRLCIGENSSSICNNPIVKAIISVLAGDIKKVGKEAFDKAKEKGLSEAKALTARDEAETEYANSCPLLNLLHQVGTSKRL